MAMPDREYYIGVDIGGTFTDVVLAESSGEKIYNAKKLTTPGNPVHGVMAGIHDALAQAVAAPPSVRRLVHATTLATNLVLERKGAELAFLTTKGFGDIFQLGKQLRLESERFNVLWDRPAALVPRRMVMEVSERMGADGRILVALDESQVAEQLRMLALKSPQAVAVCLLHGYKNPVHERALGDLVRKYLPDVYVALSSEVWPELGEYERAATTAISAYIGPMFSEYIGNLAKELKGVGVGAPLEIMQSSGGIMPASAAARKAVYSIESGPAAGVIAAAHLGQLCGHPNLISFDMGGTTAKAGLVRGGRPNITQHFRVGTAISGQSRSAGEPVKVPVIELAEVGAGGGSIAWVDRGGFLQVGPQSAGADPGPACYGFGGEEPTVTDADVILGYLDPNYFLGGKMKIYPERSRETLAKRVAEKLGLSVTDAAKGIYDLVNARMGSAIRVVTVRRGVDPREYAVMAFGGAGPGHIVDVAEQFKIPTVIVPTSPGLKSAFGLLVADMAYEYITTYIIPCRLANANEIAAIVKAMEDEGREAVRESLPDKEIVLRRSFDMRFLHQRHDMSVPVPGGPITQETIAAAEDAFRKVYAENFGVRPTDPCEFVNLRVQALGMVSKPEVPVIPLGDAKAERALKTRRKAYFKGAGGYADTPVYDRMQLVFGDTIAGPAILEEPDSTTVCPPEYGIAVDRHLNLIITRRS